jgi:hypothetical protein
MNLIQDREYKYFVATNDDGWLCGGGGAISLAHTHTHTHTHTPPPPPPPAAADCLAQTHISRDLQHLGTRILRARDLAPSTHTRAAYMLFATHRERRLVQVAIARQRACGDYPCGHVQRRVGRSLSRAHTRSHGQNLGAARGSYPVVCPPQRRQAPR